MIDDVEDSLNHTLERLSFADFVLVTQGTVPDSIVTRVKNGCSL